jgi:hypothetical protein
VARDLCTVEGVKAALGIANVAGGPTDDAYLSGLVSGVSGWLLDRLNDQLAPTAPFTDLLDGNGKDALYLSRPHLQTITAVTVDGRDIPAAAGPTDVGYFRSGHLLRVRGDRFSRGVGNVAVSGVAGVDEIPAQIVEAAVTLCVWRYKEEREHPGQSSKVVGTQTVAYQTASAPDWIKAIIDDARNVIPA